MLSRLKKSSTVFKGLLTVYINTFLLNVYLPKYVEFMYNKFPVHV